MIAMKNDECSNKKVYKLKNNIPLRKDKKVKKKRP